MYSYGFENVMNHMCFGTGIGNYNKEMIALGFDDSSLAASADPHNLFFELGGVFGIVWAVLLIILLSKLLVKLYKKTNIKDGVFLWGLVYILIFVGFASSSCMEKNYIYLALLIPSVYYRFSNCNAEAVIHIKRYISVYRI